MAGLVRITKAGGRQPSGRTSFKLGLPIEIGEPLYGKDLLYRVELTDEGILFRPLAGAVEPVELPEWARHA